MGRKKTSLPQHEVSDEEITETIGEEVSATAIPIVVQQSFSVDKFDSDTMLWDRWLQRLEGAFEIFGVPADKKVHYLVHYVGLDTFNILADKLAPANPYTASYKQIVEILGQHFCPKPLEIAEIFKFNRRLQKPNESVREYVAALQKMSIHCQFGNYLQKALRNQFVCGISDLETQKRLMEMRDLTFSKAIEIAVARESSSQSSADLQGDRSMPKVIVEANALHTEKNKRRPAQRRTAPSVRKDAEGKKCFRCGKSGHAPEKCFHIKAVCKFCKKPGHIDSACFKKKKSEPNKKVQSNVIDTVEEFAEIYVRDCVEEYSTSELRSKIWVKPKINNVPIEMELDCGAAVTTMNNDEARQKFPSLTVRESNLSLISFSGQTSKVLGVATVRVDFEGTVKKRDLYLVAEKRAPLMGREWIKSFPVDWNKFIPCVSEVNAVIADNTVPAKVSELLQHYEVPLQSGIGKISGVEVRITLKEGARPVFVKPRPVPFMLIPKLDEALSKLEKEGIYVRIHASEWGTPVVPVSKANGEVRICGDYKVTVNPQITIDAHPLPTVDELFANMQGDRYSKIDIRQAYLQLAVAPEDQEILTLSTHRGLYRPTRLQFGLASAPAIWQRTIENILAGIEGVKVFLDDIKVTGKTTEEHLHRLEETLRRLQKFNLRINRDKSFFFAEAIEYCGYRIDKAGIHPIREKMDAIVNMTRPKNRTDIQVFRGLVNYYSRFIPNYSEIMQPMNRLSREDVPFEWTADCERAWQQIKDIIASDQVLMHYDPSLEVIVATDASPFAVSAVLSHRVPGIGERPVQFASQTLSKTQQKYAHIDKEAYAIVFGIKKFHQFVFGRTFTLITDCKPLTQIFSPSKGLPVHSAMRMQHYAIFLQSYDFEIHYRKTQDHGNADALSRLPSSGAVVSVTQEPDVVQMQVLDEILLTSEEVAEATREDSALQKLKGALEKGTQLKPAERFNIDITEFTLQDDCIFRGHRVVIPASLKTKIFAELHSAHFGVTKMKLLARSICWWPGISEDLESLAKNCVQCQLVANNPEKVELHHWEEPTKPFERVHVDFAGPFLNVRYFVLVDAFSKWPEIMVVQHEDTATVVKHCDEIFSRFGIPRIMVSDNGTAFTSQEFKEYTRRNGIRHRFSAPYHPATNGQVERYNQSFKKSLKALNATEKDVQLKLREFLIAYRRTPHIGTKKSPSEMLFGSPIRTRVDLILPERKGKKDFEDASPKVRTLSVGDAVAARNYNKGPKWRFGRIKQKLGKLHYQVQVGPEEDWKRHINQLRQIGENVVEKRNQGQPVPVAETPALRRSGRVIKLPGRFKS